MVGISNQLNKEMTIVSSLRTIFFLGMVLCLSNLVLAAGSSNYNDFWTSNGGSSADGVVWGGYYLETYASGINSNADCLCWDWCDQGSSDSTIGNWDACYCATGKLNQCKSANPTLTSICNSASGGCAETSSLSSAHQIDTGSSGNKWTCGVDIKEFVDCDNSSSQKSTVDWMDANGDQYFVVYPKQYDCDNTSSPSYDFEGVFGTGDNVDIVTDISCPANKACDENDSHLNHDDVLITSATGSIPNPCSTVDGTTAGNTCGADNQCLSGYCGGEKTLNTPNCSSDGSNAVYIAQEYFQDSCGGNGHNYNDGGYSTTCTSLMGASNYVCDTGLDDQTYTNVLNSSEYCKKELNSSCGASADCWNDNGGVDCKGPTTNKICTYGDEGSFCNYDLHCDSGLACDIPNHVCTAAGGTGDSCTKDTDCQSNFCVYDSSSTGTCQLTHNPTLDITDSWVESNSNNESTADDGRLFAGETVYPISKQLRESTDMICYDFDGDGDYDACYFDTNGCVNGAGCSSSSCNVSGFTIPQSVSSSKKWACDIDSGAGCKVGVDNGTPAQICTGANCSVSTASPIFSNEVKAVGFTDCDNSDSLKGQYTINPVQTVDSQYTVIKPKYALCEKAFDPITEELVLNNPSYFSAGFNGVGDDEYFNYTCTDVTKACDILSDEQEIFTANGVIPNPCKTIPNQSCTQNSDCLYNSCNTSINKCNVGIGIEGILKDEFENLIVGKQIKLTSCGGGDTVLKTSTTDSKGKFKFYHVPGSYKLKSSAPWSSDITYIFPEGPCYSYGEGFHDIWLKLYTKANIHGKAVNPQGYASVGLDFEAATCQNVTLDSDTADSDGNFSLITDTGYQKVLVDLNGTKYPLTDVSGNACLFQYGNVDLGTQVITDNCPLYNNTCSDDNTRLFDCTNDSVKGCSCKSQYCEAGCTENAPVCNPIGTGTFKVQVLDLNGNAVVLAPVYVDNQFVGKTNGFGKKDVNVKHGSHSIKTDCPSAAVDQTKSSYLNGDTKYETFKLNCPTQQKGDLIVIVSDVNGNPLVNVAAFLDEKFDAPFGITGVFGTTVKEEVPFGKHDLSLVYRLDSNSIPLQVTYLVDINSSKTTVFHTLTKPGEIGYESYTATMINPNLIGLDDAILIGTILVSLKVNKEEYCDCIQSQSDVFSGENVLNDCIEKAEGFNASNGTALKPDSPFRKFIIEHAVAASVCEQPIVGVSKEVLSGAIIGAGLGVVAKTSGTVYKTIDSVVPVSNTLGGIAKAAGEYKIVKVGSGLINYTKKKAGLVFNEVDSFIFKPYTIEGISKLSYGGKELVEHAIEKYGSSKVKSLVGKETDNFVITNEYVSSTFNDLAKLKNSSFISEGAYSKLENGFFNYIDKGTAQNLQGSMGEIEFFVKNKLPNKILSVDAPPIGSQNKADGLLEGGDIVEVKKTNMQTVSPEQFHQVTNDLLAKIKSWNSTNPNSKIYIGFPDKVEPWVQEQVENELKTKIKGEISSLYDFSKIVFIWE